MLEVELELAKLGVPIKTRHNEGAAPEPVRDRPGVRELERRHRPPMLTMQILQNTARRYGLVCLLHEKPFAGINGSGGTTTGRWAPTRADLLDPGDTAQENLSFLFFCAAVVIQAVNRHQKLLRAWICERRRATVSGPTRRRRRSSRSSSGPAGKRLRGDRERHGLQVEGRLAAGPRDPVLPSLPLHGGDRNRTSFAFTGNKFEFRALGSSSSLRVPEHRAEHDRRGVDRRALREARESAKSRGDARKGGRRRSSRESMENERVVFGGDGYSEEWHAEARSGACRHAHDAGGAAVARLEKTVRRSASTKCSASVSSRRARGLHGAVRDVAEHRVRDGRRTRTDGASAGRGALLGQTHDSGVEELAERLEPKVEGLPRARSASSKRPTSPRTGTTSRHPSRRSTCATWSMPLIAETREIADRLEQLVADDSGRCRSTRRYSSSSSGGGRASEARPCYPWQKRDFLAATRERVIVFDGGWARRSSSSTCRGGLRRAHRQVPRDPRPHPPGRNRRGAQLDARRGRAGRRDRHLQGSPAEAGGVAFAEHTLEINTKAAQIARRAAGENTFVAGSVGRPASCRPPKNPNLRQHLHHELVAVFAEQARGLLDGGVDLLDHRDGGAILERRGHLGGREAFAAAGREVPIQHLGVAAAQRRGRCCSGPTSLRY